MLSDVPKSFTLRGFYHLDGAVVQEFRTLQFAGDITLEEAWYYLEAARPTFGIVGGRLKEIEVVPAKPKETPDETTENETRENHKAQGNQEGLGPIGA